MIRKSPAFREFTLASVVLLSVVIMYACPLLSDTKENEFSDHIEGKVRIARAIRTVSGFIDSSLNGRRL